jgi:hypothetical protein
MFQFCHAMGLLLGGALFSMNLLVANDAENYKILCGIIA